jgi:hypothetical protein
MRGNAIFLRNQWISTWMAWILAIWHKCMHVHQNDDKLHTIFIVNDKELKIYWMVEQFNLYIHTYMHKNWDKPTFQQYKISRMTLNCIISHEWYESYKFINLFYKFLYLFTI